MNRWRQQAYTGRDPITKLCNQQIDDSSTTYLYRSTTNSKQCYGLNFSTYEIDGSNINPYAAFTYDATVLLAYGIQNVLHTGATITGNNMNNGIITNVTFNGASGYVQISNLLSSATKNGKLPEAGRFQHGARENGDYYKIMNFNEDAYYNNRNNSFVQVMYWNSELETLDCDESMGCYNIIYATESNTPTSDTRTTIVVTLNNGLRVLLFVLGALVLVLVAGVCFFLYFYRSSKLIKASQPMMMYFILLGEVIGGARVINTGLEITDHTCTAGIWLGHMAFFLVFGCLFLKTWRIHKLVNNPTLKRIKITVYDILRMLFVMQLCVIIYLIILTMVGKPHRSDISSTSSNQTTELVRCSFVNPNFHTALFAIEGVIVIIGARLCWAVKDVPDAINEAKYIAMGK
jgi:hypothetical protein